MQPQPPCLLLAATHTPPNKPLSWRTSRRRRRRRPLNKTPVLPLKIQNNQKFTNSRAKKEKKKTGY
jgi:hypothetical protein